MDKTVSDLYIGWKKSYIKNECSDTTQYYVLYDENDMGDDIICVSEGQGYGMLITVLMAGFDPSAQKIYDGLFLFYKAHPSRRGTNLMTWNILRGCISNTAGKNQTSATDGDFDIALSLLMASLQWGDNGKINYRREATGIIGDILKYEINHDSYTVLLGDGNIRGDPDYYDIRSSDFMPLQLKAFSRFYHDGTWNRVLDKMYKVLSDLQDKFSPDAGLLPDFIMFCKREYVPARPNYLESVHDGDFYYNACRFPMRVALDGLIYGSAEADTLLTTLNDWIQMSSNNSVENISAGYHLNGQRIDKLPVTVPSFVCPVAVGAMTDKDNQQWLNDLWDYITTEFQIKDYQYYDNTLMMLSLLIMSGNYWAP